MNDITQERKNYDSLGTIYPAANDVTREHTTIDGVPCIWFYPNDIDDNAGVVIYIHGGAFMLGSERSHGPLVSHIAQTIRRRVLFIDFRLAPENSFPAALTDVTKVVEALLEQEPNLSFGIIGDSSGGNLTMALQLQLRENKMTLPKYSIVISPFVDLECKNASYTTNKSLDPFLTLEILTGAAKLYAGNHPLNDPLVSPVNGHFEGLSPVLIMVGTNEILADDADHLYNRLIESKVTAGLVIFKGAPHVFPQTTDIDAENSRAALALMNDFVRRYS